MAATVTVNFVCAACDGQMGPSLPAANEEAYLVGCGHVVCKACSESAVMDFVENEDRPRFFVGCLRCGVDVSREPHTRLYLSTVEFAAGGNDPRLVFLREEEARLSAEAAGLFEQVSTELAEFHALEDRLKSLRGFKGMSDSLKRRRVDGAE
ncbi:hypothetical protein FRC12_012984 [Ceratobasidium sp. 428]|nr:hypothetical protein FRC12_012984 [Ceratobasidium sp. 428]